MNRSRLATRYLSAVFVHTFAAAARVRRGRPIHPRGAVLDATLRVHGTVRTWGVAFLDDEAELPGIPVRGAAAAVAGSPGPGAARAAA